MDIVALFSGSWICLYLYYLIDQVSLSSVTSIIDGLKKLYIQKLKPLEVTYRFNDFVSPLLVSHKSVYNCTRSFSFIFYVPFPSSSLIHPDVLPFLRQTVILMLSRWWCFWVNIPLEKQHLLNICSKVVTQELTLDQSLQQTDLLLLWYHWGSLQFFMDHNFLMK